MKGLPPGTVVRTLGEARPFSAGGCPHCGAETDMTAPIEGCADPAAAGNDTPADGDANVCQCGGVSMFTIEPFPHLRLPTDAELREVMALLRRRQ